MGLPEKISGNLQLAESKKQSLRKSILGLAFQWKGFEEHFGLTQKGFQECVSELESRENQLKSVQKSVSEIFHNLEVVQKSVEKMIKDVEDREKKVISLYERGVMELESKEINLASLQEKYEAEFQCREKKLREREKAIEGVLEEFESQKLQIEGIKKLVDEGFKKIGLKEKCFEDQRKEIELLQLSVERRASEVDFKEREIIAQGKKSQYRKGINYVREELEREVELKQKELDFMTEDIELRDKELEYIRGLNEKLMKEFNMREKKSESERTIAQERFKELELRKKEYQVKEDMLEKELKDLESKRKELDTWEKKLESDRKFTHERIKELALRKKECQVKEDRLEKESKDLELKKKELDMREKKLESEKKFAQEQFEALNLRKKECQVKEDMLGKETKELELKKRELDMKVKKLESEKKFTKEHFKELDSKKKECQLKEDMLQKESFNLESKKKELDTREKKLETEKKFTEERLKELDSKKENQVKEDMLEKESKNLELKKKELDARGKKLESEKKFTLKRCKELDLERKEFQVKEAMLEKESKNLELKKKELDAGGMKLESEKKFTEELSKELDSKKKECQAKEDKLEREFKDLEAKRKELEDRIKKIEYRERELELKEKQLNNVDYTHVKPETELNESLTSNSFSLDIRIVVLMGGKSLQIFLNEHENDLDTMGDEVFEALQLLKDPAKLVINAMEGFYPPRLRKGDREFKGFVVRKSCILLLEQLMRLSPNIQSCVRDEALEIARKWKTKITVENPLEVLGFIYLLACYNLASAFDTGEIVHFLEMVADHHQTPNLCRRLGLQEEIPCLIQNLLQSKNSLKAIRYIYAFELVDRFPPVPILENYLKHVKKSADALCNKRCNTRDEQNEAIDKKVAAMRDVIRCIVDNRLERQYSPKSLEEDINELLMQKTDTKCTRSADSHKAQGQQQVEVKQISSTSTAAAPSSKALKLASDSSNSLIGPPSPLAVILANMRGKNLLSFLSLHSDEHELLHNEVFTALQNCDHPAKLVLDAIEGFYHSYPTEDEERSAIFLFEQLMRLSPHVTSDVKEVAYRIASDWLAKIRGETQSPPLILRFLLLISTYNLASAYNRDQLLNLYQTVAKHKPAPGLHEALGISKMISDSAANLSKFKGQQARSELVDGFTASSSIVPVFGIELRNGMDREEGECNSICSEVATIIYKSSDPAQLVLHALQNCHPSKFTRSIFMSFFHLLEHLMNVSPDIKPCVKEHALTFALHWKEKSKGPPLWDALVFLQLVATYQLAYSFETDELLSLLEVAFYSKKAHRLFRILGLVEKVPGFIWKLIQKKQLLLAFEYVYEFKLLDEFPPVALLKQHVLHSECEAKKICNTGRKAPKTQDKAIAAEISELKAVIRRIMHHNLQHEYSPDELTARIRKLERANLKLNGGKNVSLAQKTRLHEEDKRKCPAQDATPIYEAHSRRARKRRRLDSPAEIFPNPSRSTHDPVHSLQPFSQHPGDLYDQHIPLSSRAPVEHHNLGGLAFVMPDANQLAWHCGSDVAGIGESLHSCFPSNYSWNIPNYIPPSMLGQNQSFCPPLNSFGHSTFREIH